MPDLTQAACVLDTLRDVAQTSFPMSDLPKNSAAQSMRARVKRENLIRSAEQCRKAQRAAVVARRKMKLLRDVAQNYIAPEAVFES